MAVPRPAPRVWERQYLHRSGRVFVRVFPDGNFAWVRNRLATGKVDDASGSSFDGVDLLAGLRDHAALLDALADAFDARLPKTPDAADALVDAVADFLGGPKRKGDDPPQTRYRRAPTDENVAPPESLSGTSTPTTHLSFTTDAEPTNKRPPGSFGSIGAPPSSAGGPA